MRTSLRAHSKPVKPLPTMTTDVMDSTLPARRPTTRLTGRRNRRPLSAFPERYVRINRVDANGRAPVECEGDFSGGEYQRTHRCADGHRVDAQRAGGVGT